MLGNMEHRVRTETLTRTTNGTEAFVSLDER